MTTKAEVIAAREQYERLLTEFFRQYGWERLPNSEDWLLLWFERDGVTEHTKWVFSRIAEEEQLPTLLDCKGILKDKPEKECNEGDRK